VPHEGRHIPLADIEASLEAAKASLKPGTSMTISGGEPLVDPRLERILSSARKRGIREFTLQTNMIGLGQPDRFARLVRLGVSRFDASFHSHIPSRYNAITGSAGLFPKAVEGLKALAGNGSIQVSLCVLLTKLNYQDLPALMGFFGKLQKEHRPSRALPLEISFSLMNGAGMNTASRMAVDLGLAAPFVWEAIQRCLKEGLKPLRFDGEGAVPPCILPKPADYACVCRFSQDRVRYAVDFSGETGSVGRAKKPACRRCPYDLRCLGVPAEYARLFGLKALRPPC
jgi:hypothetical protein